MNIYSRSARERSDMKGFERYIEEQITWSRETFGDGERLEGLCQHIESEVEEVRACNGEDLYEWIDVIILALDGAWRSGFSPPEITTALRKKQNLNKARVYERVAPDQPSFHVKRGK